MRGEDREVEALQEGPEDPLVSWVPVVCVSVRWAWGSGERWVLAVLPEVLGGLCRSDAHKLRFGWSCGWGRDLMPKSTGLGGPVVRGRAVIPTSPGLGGCVVGGRGLMPTSAGLGGPVVGGRCEGGRVSPSPRWGHVCRWGSPSPRAPTSWRLRWE